jgi:hypothetical protein
MQDPFPAWPSGLRTRVISPTILSMRRRPSHAARRLRIAVERLPKRTKEAMLRGIDTNRIVVGAYVDPESGGVCPMLAAHRNGGRTSVASFARAWDEYTDARRPRRATRREVRCLRDLLLESLDVDPALERKSIAELAAQIRAERAQLASCRSEPVEPTEPPEPDAPIRVRRRVPTGERHRGAELRLRPNWAWLRPARRYDEYKDLLAAAEEQLSEQRAVEVLGESAETLRVS